VVGVAEEPRVHLGHAAEQRPLVVGERIPRSHGVELRPALGAVGAGLVDVGVDRRELGPVGEDAELLLALEHVLAILLVAHVELALVLVDPLLRGVVGRMAGARAVVEEERLVGRDRLGVGDERQRAISEVGGQVIAVLG